MANFKRFREFVNTVWIGANSFMEGDFSPTHALENQYPAWLMDDTLDESVAASFVWALKETSTPVIKLYYSMLVATSGNLDIDLSMKAKSDGEDLQVALTFAGRTTVAVPGTIDFLDVITLDVSSAPTLSPGDLVTIFVSYSSSSTTTGDMGFYGITISDA